MTRKMEEKKQENTDSNEKRDKRRQVYGNKSKRVKRERINK